MGLIKTITPTLTVFQTLAGNTETKGYQVVHNDACLKINTVIVVSNTPATANKMANVEGVKNPTWRL